MTLTLGGYLPFTRITIDAKLENLSLLDQVLCKRVGEEVQLVSLGLQDQVVCDKMEEGVR
jgi:hypothetical protein